MKYIGYLIIGLALLVLVGCKPDFPVPSLEIPTETSFLFPDSISLSVDHGGCATINGVDSCFVEIVDGDDVVEMNVIYNVGDKYFFEGITSIIKIQPLAVGEALFRLFNNKLEFDTTVKVKIIEKENSNDTMVSAYTFYPEDRRFLITQEGTELSVIGPKPMGTKVLDVFILSSSANGSNSITVDDQTAYKSWINISFNFIGTAYVKFYNEDFDTLVRVDVLPIYNTFEEPEIDFDDTRDSVLLKLGNPQVENSTEGYYIYNCQGEAYPYTLQVRFTSLDMIKDYEVTFENEVAKTELRAFVEERYMQRGTWNGYYIFARAYNTTYPNLYDNKTKVLVENFLQGKIVYKNPENYPNW